MHAKLAMILASLAAFAPAQTTVTGYNLALRSSGTRSSTAGTATLVDNGFVGTYVTLTQPGQVTLAVDATGVDARMNVVVNDSKTPFDVTSAGGVYTTTLNLPAGTHFVRTEFANDIPTANRSLTVRGLTVAGANVSNVGSSANALAAADTYVANYRKTSASLRLPGVNPGDNVRVKLLDHAFRFGTAVPGGSSASSVNTYLANNPAAGSTAAKFQQALLKNFNGVTPENSGKWSNNEATQNVVTMGGSDRVMEFAENNGLRVRQHNLIWGSQQPAYMNTNIASAIGGNATARATVDSEIAQRINYYVRDRGNRFEQLDVYNESYHTGSATAASNYWNLFGAAGVAKVHNDTAAALAGVGSDATLFTNEYNVLADSYNAQSQADPFANWYRSHVETIRNAGGKIDGIGIQYYAHNVVGSGMAQHDAARIFQTLQNLSVSGLNLELTEFGIKTDGTGTAAEKQANAALVLRDTLRLVFGNANATGFTNWGFWAGSVWDQAPAGVLYNTDWTLTPAGQMFQDLMSTEWTVDLATAVDDDGLLSFNGYYGLYELSANGQTYLFDLQRDGSHLVTPVPEPAAAGLIVFVSLFASGRIFRLTTGRRELA